MAVEVCRPHWVRSRLFTACDSAGCLPLPSAHVLAWAQHAASTFSTFD